VMTMHGGPRLMPLRWVGKARIDLARDRRLQAMAPILIRRDALGAGVPHRDLRVSPEHAIHLDGRLVPARLLVNGRSIIQERYCRAVTYYHLEIEGHGLLISDGAVTESYYDDGNRAMFDNADFVWVAGGFDAGRDQARYAEAACAPLVYDGLELDRIRARIEEAALEMALASAPTARAA